MSSDPAAGVALTDATIAFGDDVVIPELDLDIRPGEFTTLLGPSGCGKTTLLRAIAGFVDLTRGSLRIGNRDVTRVEAERRGVGFVFQSYALFPHLTVRRNLEFGLKVQGLARAERPNRVAAMLDLLELAALADRYPAGLSGGQQQRVAIGRVLITRPHVLLMDEPLSNLDVALRVAMREELQRIHREAGVTTVYVTHDQEEALALSDRIAVLKGGEVQQFDAPQAIYARPANAFVARFVGAMNVLSADAAASFALRTEAGRAVGVRPEVLRLGEGQHTCDHEAPATVAAASFLGATSRYRVRVGDDELTVVAAGAPRFRVGEQLTLGFAAADVVAMKP